MAGHFSTPQARKSLRNGVRVASGFAVGLFVGLYFAPFMQTGSDCGPAKVSASVPFCSKDDLSAVSNAILLSEASRRGLLVAALTSPQQPLPTFFPPPPPPPPPPARLSPPLSPPPPPPPPHPHPPPPPPPPPLHPPALPASHALPQAQFPVSQSSPDIHGTRSAQDSVETSDASAAPPRAESLDPGAASILAESGIDALSQKQLVDEFIPLLGVKALSRLIKSSHRYSVAGILRVMGPQGDDGVALVVREQAKDVYGIRSNGFKLGNGDIYVDVGGHIGTPIVMAAHRFEHVRIVCFEALPENYFYIRWNLLAHGFKNDEYSRVRVYNRAVGAVSGEVIEVHYMPKATTSSGSFKDERIFGRTVSHKVTTISLRDVLTKYVAGLRVGFLKLDCEGCEWTAVAQLTDGEFRELFSGKLQGEIHFLPECWRRGWKRYSVYCDDNFAKRACGNNSEACCSTLNRLCLPTPKLDGCRDIRQRMILSGYNC